MCCQVMRSLKNMTPAKMARIGVEAITSELMVGDPVNWMPYVSQKK